LITDKQEDWEKNIVVLKKGEHHPLAIKNFAELKEILPFYQPFKRKKCNIDRLNQKWHLERKY
jgi:hypothetical protein